MAVATESFSIREYTERMRSIDLRRCWPFDDGSEARPLLPSISVRRFKWWGDEIDFARSMEIVGEEDDPSKDAPAATVSEADGVPQRPRTATEPSAAPKTGVEGRRTANKGKQRAPKKRSIVELFAAAPLIAGAVDADEGERWEEEDVVEEEEKEEIDVVMRKKKAMKENVIKKKKRWKKKKKNKGIKDGLKLEIRAWEKVKICKPKTTSSVQSYTFQNSVCSRKSRETAKSFVESQQQPAKERAVRKKHKVLRTSILFSKNQEFAKKLPVHSILKNQKRGAMDRKSSKSVGAKAADLIKLYCKSNRHVTFSVKDDIAGSNSRACSSMDLPQLQNLCKIFSDVLAASSAMNHPSKGHDLPDAKERPQEPNACEKGTHSSVASRIEASSAEKNKSSDSIINPCQPTVANSSNSSCSGMEKAPFAVMVDLNHAIDADDMDCGIPAASTLSTSCIYSGDTNSRAALDAKNPNSTSDIHLEPGLVPAPIDKFVASFDVTSSMTLQKNPSSHSPSSCMVVYSKTNERQCQSYADSDANFCRRQTDEHQSGAHRSPKGGLSNICYSMGSKKFGESLFSPNSVSASRSKCPGEDFIGLPLNSQGEFIQFHSGTKFGEPYNKQNMEWGSSHGLSANRHVDYGGRMHHLDIMRRKAAGAASYQKNQSEWNQKQCYSTRERVRHWLNFAELEGSERLEIQNNEPVRNKDMFLHCNSNPRSHFFHEYRNGDAAHDFCDRVDLHYRCQPAAAVQPTMRLMGKNVILSSINRDHNGFDDGRTWNNGEDLANQTQFSPLSQQWMHRECAVSHPAAERSKGTRLELFDSPPNVYHMKALEHSLDYMNITQQPQWPSRNADSASAAAAAAAAVANRNFKLDMNRRALPPQFLGKCMSGEGSVGAGRRCPAAVISSHPQNLHQNKLLSSSLCQHNLRSSTAQPQFIYQDFGNFSQPPLLQQPAAKLPQWLLHAKHQKRTQLSDSHYSDPNAANSNHHLSPYHAPMIPFLSRGDADPRRPFAPPIAPPAAPAMSNGDVNKRSISIKKKLAKRPADFDDGMINSAKRASKGQSDPNAMEEPNGAEPTNEKGLITSNSLKIDGYSGPKRPTKLIAGAKHILKPCERMDEENCRLIHSTIIVPPSAHASVKLFAPEKKISNIYNF